MPIFSTIARARVLIVHESLWPKIASILDAASCLEHVILIGGSSDRALAYDDWIDGEPNELAPARTHREDFCTLNYSSGTTGQPKGILHAHKDLALTAVYHNFLCNPVDDVRPGSSGKPVPGYDTRIVDDEGVEVGTGEVGNLMIRGESIALSYWHQYERSHASFRGDWFFTGDKYKKDADGYYWNAGRSDDMLKVGGIWVSPMEVESVLISHEAVAECAVVAFRDGSGLVKPKAFVVLRETFDVSAKLADELIAFCREQMAQYKRPRKVEFLDELPKTATGKIQRYKLRKGQEAT